MKSKIGSFATEQFFTTNKVIYDSAQLIVIIFAAIQCLLRKDSLLLFGFTH